MWNMYGLGCSGETGMESWSGWVWNTLWQKLYGWNLKWSNKQEVVKERPKCHMSVYRDQILQTDCDEAAEEQLQFPEGKEGIGWVENLEGCECQLVHIKRQTTRT